MSKQPSNPTNTKTPDPKANTGNTGTAKAVDTDFSVDTSVTRQQLIDSHYQGIPDPEKEFDKTLEAMGLKAGGKKFKAQTAYFIVECRGWINSGQIDSYEALAEHWHKSKETIAQNFTKMQSSLAQSDSESGITTGTNLDGLTDANPALILAEPAQASYTAGQEIIEQASARISHNQQLTAQVIDAAFFEGVKDGVNTMGEAGKKPQLPALLTKDQAKSIVAKVVKDSQQQTN